VGSVSGLAFEQAYRLYCSQKKTHTSYPNQRNLVFFVKVTDIPGKKRGRYIPKYYVFRGFHLSTCQTQAAPLILIDRSGIRLHPHLEQVA